MSDELIRIKKKVHALLAKTVSNGCSEHEAMAAAAKAGELMDFYSLQITDIEIRETKCKHLEITLDTVIGGKLDACVVAIGKFCDTKSWFTRGRKIHGGPITQGAVYHFFGLEQDVEMAEYIYKILDHAVEGGLESFKRTDAYKNAHRKKAATKSFSTAFSSRIYWRLVEMKKERNVELAKQEAAMERTGRAVLVVKQDHVESEFNRDLGIKLVTRSSSKRSYNSDAYAAGFAAANKVNINKGIGHKSTALLA